MNTVVAVIVTMLLATASAAATTSAAAAAAPERRAPSSFRQLQFFPQFSDEDANAAPDTFPGREAFPRRDAFPREAFPEMERESFPNMRREAFPGMEREAFPENDMPIGAGGGAWETDMATRNWNGNAMNGGAGGVEADTVANGTTTTTTTDTTGATTDIAPGQPTIMVLLPDFLASGSGWSSYSGDVSATHAPETKPVEETPTSAASRPSSSGRLLVAAVTLCVSLALSIVA